MLTFLEWLHLIETYYGLDTGQYNALFDGELEKLIGSVSNLPHRKALERMRGFNWVGYIAASLRHAGFRDQREVQERTHNIITKLVMGTLFRGFDERASGPMDLRFKRSVANTVKNIVAKERNRRHYLPSVPIQQGFDAGLSVQSSDDDEQVIDDFRRLLHERLGDLAVAVFDLRMAGGETKSLVAVPALGAPGIYVIKRVVQDIKRLAHEYAASLDNSALLWRIERAMGRESETIQRRKATTRQRVGA